MLQYEHHTKRQKVVTKVLHHVCCRHANGAGPIAEDEEGPAIRLGGATGALDSAPSGNTSAAGGLTTSHSGQYDSTGQATAGVYAVLDDWPMFVEELGLIGHAVPDIFLSLAT